MNNDTITVSTNFWRVPSVETAFSGWLEGAPTESEKLQVIAKTEAARAAWSPSAEGMELVEKLKSFVGYRVQIQFWDSCMYLLEEEGPYPLNATVKGVVLLMDAGFQQAFLQVSDAVEQPNLDGYSPMSYLIQRPESEFLFASLSDLYSITKV